MTLSMQACHLALLSLARMTSWATVHPMSSSTMVQGKEQKQNDSVHAGMSFGAAEPGSHDQLGNRSSHVQLYHGSREGTKAE